MARLDGYKIKADANPYDLVFKEYFQERKLKQRKTKDSRATFGGLREARAVRSQPR